MGGSALQRFEHPTVGPRGPQPVAGGRIPTVTTGYSTTTGQVTTTTTTTGGTVTITREYDQLGRLYRYTDADGGVTTNEFDRYGKPSKVSDPTGFATFTYNRTAEPRGFLTSVTDSIAGTFGAAYSPDGQLTTLVYPNGMTRVDTLDANLTPVARTYKRTSDSTVIHQENVVTNSHGEVALHTYTGGSRAYSYDRIGRLTSVNDHASGGCTRRTYAYDSRTNRTGRTSYATDTDCTTTTVDTQTSHSHDSADRLQDTDYTYDPFGRLTTVPGGLTNSYYANDLVRQQTLDASRQTWTLDPIHRLRGFTTETNVSGSWVNASSKLNHYGDDSDEPRWIIEDTATGALTRMVTGPDGDLAATTSATGDARYQVVNLHGDVVTTLDTTLIPPGINRYDEFGVPAQDATRYGWLGGKQRSAEALGDVVLMGVRLYHPDTGRFLQPDPVDGGSATTYDYCNADPVNCTDLDGRWPSWSSIKKAVNVVAKVAEVASMIPGPIGTIAGVVSAVSYAATGNWKAAAWAVAGAAAAVVGAGAAVKVAKYALSSTRLAKAAAPATRALRSCKDSFTPDTQVLMADGTTKAIRDVHVGDHVLATDPETGVTGSRQVTAEHLNLDPELTDLQIKLPNGSTTTIHTTPEHPFWDATLHAWVDAGDLQSGHLLRTTHGVPATITSAVSYTGAKWMHNLTVTDFHTYYVLASETPVLVHNAGRCKSKLLKIYEIDLANGRTYVGRTFRATLAERYPRIFNFGVGSAFRGSRITGITQRHAVVCAKCRDTWRIAEQRRMDDAVKRRGKILDNYRREFLWNKH